ncbi:MAG TPA: hypothetical protein VF173_21245 [Thermoanaerobaculia bacterium]|nr:hypothetical protein [Thermoanaerobaculia bacterium]
MSRRRVLLSVAAAFLVASGQVQAQPVKITQETDEHARNRLALELAVQLTAKLPQLLQRFSAQREEIARAERSGTDPVPLVRELLDSTEAELRGEVDSPDFAPLRDKVAAVFQKARSELGLLDAKSASRRLPARLPAGIAFASFSQGTDRETVLDQIASFLRRFLDLAQGKNLVVDLCVVSRPVQEAVLDMSPPSEPLKVSHGRTPAKLLHLFRGLYTYSIEGKGRLIKCQPPKGALAPCLVDLWAESKPTLDCNFDLSDCSAAEGWPVACEKPGRR